MMTEKEAWEFCAKAFERAKMGYDGRFRVDNDNSCLCDFIRYGTKEIPSEVVQSMLEKIDALPNFDIHGFKWPTDESGTKQRVEFCKRMAKECEK